jgi:hypothetical protein
MPYSPDTSISTGVYRSSKCGRRTETFAVRRSWLFLPPQPAPLSISLAHHIASSRSGPCSPWCPWPGSRKTPLASSAVRSLPADRRRKSRSSCAWQFLRGNHSPDHQSVTEQHPPTRLQHAKHFGQHVESAWNMAQNVIREHGVKGRFVEGKILGSVAVQPFFGLSTLIITEALPSSSCLLLA